MVLSWPKPRANETIVPSSEAGSAAQVEADGSSSSPKADMDVENDFGALLFQNPSLTNPVLNTGQNHMVNDDSLKVTSNSILALNGGVDAKITDK